jgi:carbon monoxide dehydrogenase subunit G
MRISGQFTTTASVGALRALNAEPEKLSALPTLGDVVSTADGRFAVVFTAATPFGPQPIEARVVTERADETGSALRVHGRRGTHVIDVELTISWEEIQGGTAVSWEAEVGVRGPAASVAQRVAADVARCAIGDLLVSAAASV